MAADLLDKGYLADMRQWIGEGAFALLVAQAPDHLGGALGNVLTAWQGADTEALRQHAHRLRGAAASVGCLALSSAALDLMHDSRPAVLVGGGEMELLHRLTGRSLAALAELAASPVQPQAMPVPPKPQ